MILSQRDSRRDSHRHSHRDSQRDSHRESHRYSHRYSHRHSHTVTDSHRDHNGNDESKQWQFPRQMYSCCGYSLTKRLLLKMYNIHCILILDQKLVSLFLCRRWAVGSSCLICKQREGCNSGWVWGSWQVYDVIWEGKWGACLQPTVVQNKQKSRRSTCSSIRSFFHTAHSFFSYALVILLVRSAAFTHSSARSLTQTKARAKLNY